MIMAKEYNFIKIIGFSLLCLTLWALPIVTMAKTNTDSFYGGQSLNSIVDGEKMTLTLPGGAKVAMENQETAYTLPDHTQSTRLAVATDNTISEPIVYTPFGDNQATGETSLTESYTGQTFEPEIATYDYHARRYDGSINRFLSVDAMRQTSSPYVYVSNNPINRIDPSGNFDGIFDALDLAITPQQSLELSNVSSLKTRRNSTLGFSNGIVKKPGEATPPIAQATHGTNVGASNHPPTAPVSSPLDTPLARRLMAIHTDPKNSERVNAVRSTLTKSVGPDTGEDSMTYIYYSKHEPAKTSSQGVKSFSMIHKMANRFEVLYTPHSIEFTDTLRDSQSLYYITDVIRDQYLNYIKRVDGRNKDIRYIKHISTVNREGNEFLERYYGKIPRSFLLKGFLLVKGSGRSTKRVLDEFGLRATDISVDGLMNAPDVTIYVESKL